MRNMAKSVMECEGEGGVDGWLRSPWGMVSSDRARAASDDEVSRGARPRSSSAPETQSRDCLSSTQPDSTSLQPQKRLDR